METYPKYIEVIKNHEKEYERFIKTGNVPKGIDYSKLLEAVLYVGKENPSPLMLQFANENPDNILTPEFTAKKVLGFIDTLIMHGIKEVNFFKAMTIKEMYEYAAKRLLFNRKYVIDCSTYFIFEEFLEALRNNDVVVEDPFKYIKE